MRAPVFVCEGRFEARFAADLPAQMLQVEMFEDRDRESAPVWWFFSLPTICERLKKSAILFPAVPIV